MVQKTFLTFISLTLFLTTLSSGADKLEQTRKYKPNYQLNQRMDDGSGLQVKEDELRRFVKAKNAIQKIRGESMEKIVSFFEQESINASRYHEMVKIRLEDLLKSSNTKKLNKDNFKLTEEELKVFKKAKKKVKPSQRKRQNSMNQILKKYELTPERFREITFALKIQEELSRRVKYMESELKD